MFSEFDQSEIIVCLFTFSRLILFYEKKKLEKKSPKQKVDNSSLFRDWRKLKTLRIICIPRIPDCLGVTVFWLCKSICACVCVCVWTTNIKAKGAISMVTVQYELVWLMWMYPLDPSSHRMYVCMCECLFRKKVFFFGSSFSSRHFWSTLNLRIPCIGNITFIAFLLL